MVQAIGVKAIFSLGLIYTGFFNMKAKIYLGIAVVLTALYSCDSHTYEEIEDPTIIVGDVTYDAHVKSIINSNCISCHSDGNVAAFRPLTNYNEVKEAVEMTDLL